MTIAELQQEFLASGEKRIAPEDFFILLAHALDREKTFLFAHPEYALDRESEKRARHFFSRRIQREPVAYITGHKEFYGRNFSVTQDTLIPRPETEMLVRLVLDEAESRMSNLSTKTLTDRPESGGKEKTLIADIGTGSGNIIISIASELMRFHSRFSLLDAPFSLYATDISAPALAVAQKNALRHHTDDRITFYAGDLLAPIKKELLASKSVIIAANLPYLSYAAYANAPADVRGFEPESALVSEQAGLAHSYRLLDTLKSVSGQHRAITLFLEISPEQSAPLQARASNVLPGASFSIHQDLAGRERVLEIRRGEPGKEA